MTDGPSLPARLTFWRLDEKRHAAQWDAGEGARRFGGRWNPRGAEAVYCSTDPATAILEVAVHKGFRTFATVPHVLSAAVVEDTSAIRVVAREDVPVSYWLEPGLPEAAQQDYGRALIAAHPFVMIPSAVSPHSWNLIFDPEVARGRYRLLYQEDFRIDSRLLTEP